MLKYFIILFSAFAVSLPLLFAASPAVGAIKCSDGFEQDASGITCVPKGGAQGGLAGATSYLDVLRIVLETLLTFAGAVSVIAIVYAGIQYLTSGGSDEVAKKAKANLQYAITGVIITILAYAIVRIVVSTITTGTN